jgi:4-amino-4-deoxy-L-arabinose transferase-like glycosyltransferase
MSSMTVPRLDFEPTSSPYPVGAAWPDAPDQTNTPAEHDPRWGKAALVALLAVTAGLYLWGLGASGWANSFYSAAVQAGTKSWKAFFFGSSDAANSITVDKPPVALWVMELSARVFGVNAWSILVPQALEGVAAVGLLYASVRRWFGVRAGLLAGLVFALTPVAALMFRFNNPDAMLVLLLVGAAAATVRAIENGHTSWLLLAAGLVGLAFLTKMLQAFVVVPAFAGAYLLAAPVSLRCRLGQLLAAGAALVASSFWWVVAVMAVPAADRPYIGGSQNNSLWNLIFGYNGFGRLTGNETGSVGGGGPAGGRWGLTGLTRMFNSEFGGQTAWLIPAALILLAAGLFITARAARTDRLRAALVLWGGWLVVTMAVFSFGRGIIHPYYAVALAPAIGALIGIGGMALWVRRHQWYSRVVLAGAVATTAVWSEALLARTPQWHPWLRGLVLFVGLAVAVAFLAEHIVPRGLGQVAAGMALVVGLAGPGAYTLATVSTAHAGAIPSAGPSGGGGFGEPGGFGVAGGRIGFANRGGFGRRFRGAIPGGFAGGFPGGFTPPAGRVGGLLNGSKPSAALVQTLEQDSSKYTWVAAAIGSNEASGYQLATGKSVMPIGGFNGTDPSPTLAQFETWVREGKIHYFIAGGAFGRGGFPGGGGFPGSGGGSSTSSQISSWVASNFASTSVGGVTLYDLTTSISAS